MKKGFKRITAFVFLSLLALFCSSALCAAAEAGKGVTWEFREAEKQEDGKLKVSGVLTNHTDKDVARLDNFSYHYTRNGADKKATAKEPRALNKPLPAGQSRGYSFFLSAGEDTLAGITMNIQKVSFTDGTSGGDAAQASQPEKKTVVKGVKSQSVGHTIEGDEYVFRIAIYNNTDQQITRIGNLTLTVTYKDGEKKELKTAFNLSKPLAPNDYVTIKRKLDARGNTGETVDASVYDATFEPYDEPEREYGPKKGNALWVSSKSAVSQGQWRLEGNFQNNTAEDIVTINTYTMSFNHDDGKYVSHRGPWILDKPVGAYSSNKYTVSVPADIFKNVRNVTFSDITYMTRPTSARPKPAASASGGGAGGGGTASYNVKTKSRADGEHIIQLEILNNSSSQPLVRLDNAIVYWTAYHDHQKKLQTVTVNIPPLGTKTIEVPAGKDAAPTKIKFTYTPRFGQAKSDEKTLIIKQ